MLCFLVATCLLATCLGAVPRLAHPRFDGRIVGGTPAEISNFPYQVSFEYFGSHRCGASIISADWVVTAAHCVEGISAKNIRFRAGSSYKGNGGTLHQASEFIIHPKYDGDIYKPNYDIAVVKVSVPFASRDTVQPISLTSVAPSAGTPVVVTGWGRLVSGGASPSQLQRVQVNIVDFDTCNKDYNYLGGITSVMICAGVPAGGKDACQGDSGGPLVSNGKLVGVVSWGEGCAEPGYPGVYSDVSALKSWVSSVTGVN